MDDKRRTSLSYNVSTDKLKSTGRKLKVGRHAVRVVATDGAGISASKRWSFRVVR